MAGIIKAGELQKGAKVARHVEFNFDDMSDRASEYLSTVKQQAAHIVTSAREQADGIKSEAQQQGHQAAAQAAAQAAEAAIENQWRQLLPALHAAIEEVQRLKSCWLQQWERNAVQLAVAIAERIVRRELLQQPEIPTTWIREALELAAGSHHVKLQLNPADYQTLTERRDEIAAEFENLAPTDIVPHDEVRPGGCRVVTEYGQIDQQLETQLNRIREELSS
jgi:flagellar assembly protein FliH